MNMTTSVPPWVSLVGDPGLAPNRATLPKLQTAADVALLLAPTFDASEVELFVVLALDRQNRPIHRQVVSMGTVDTTLVHPREVFRAALIAGAASIIVAHNHPSGDPTSSVEDRAITRQLREAGRVLDVPLLDHLIYGGPDSYTSLAAEMHLSG